MTPREHVDLPDGTHAILCSRGRRIPNCGERDCTNRADLLCDFPIGPGKTCDARICNAHAKEVGPDRHFCPRHAVECSIQEELL